MSEWLYEKEMEQIIGLIFKVRNEMGAGWSEEIYHQALLYLAQKNGIPAQSKPHRSLIHRGVEIYTFEPDMIIWDKIILELKVLLNHKGKEFPPINQAQLLQYLNFYKKELGVLINFAHPKVGIKRMLFEPPAFDIDEDYERMLPHVTESDKQILREVQRHVKMIAAHYGLGYSETLYRKLIPVELAYQKIPCISDVTVPAVWEDQMLGRQSTPYMLIADRFLLHVRSSLEMIPPHDFLKTRTYLKALSLTVGWIVNFGHNQLQIYATAVE
ncbi:MAG: GxxExxY protein [Chloroflexi bacterium]|nr:GxxExxY protein [Ardenticatenaceae bacterium]NOG35508.1 GxxExxY protein [Chloroflexota bacterium]GIK57457.1 MAG: hypothetical protein BroJett015_31200 [Chloroflexota bacterium]